MQKRTGIWRITGKLESVLVGPRLETGYTADSGGMVDIHCIDQADGRRGSRDALFRSMVALRAGGEKTGDGSQAGGTGR